jgi:hypothetical protein
LRSQTLSRVWKHAGYEPIHTRCCINKKELEEEEEEAEEEEEEEGVAPE